MLKADKLIKDQAILRYKEQNARRLLRDKDYKPAPPPQGSGNTIVGSIFDCNRVKFAEMLRRYSDRLYVGWNPYKKEGQGCWEIWHRPSKKTPILQTNPKRDGIAIWTLEYKPNDFEHWVSDLDYLSYDYIAKLKEMDSWENGNKIADHDSLLEEDRLKREKAEDEHIKYVVRHNKSAFRELLDYTQAGFDPLQFFTKKSK